MAINALYVYMNLPSYSIKARAYLIIWLLLSRKKLGLLGSHRIGREAVSEAAISHLKGGKTFIVVARRDKIASSSSCRTPHVGKEGQRGEGESNRPEFFTRSRVRIITGTNIYRVTHQVVQNLPLTSM